MDTELSGGDVKSAGGIGERRPAFRAGSATYDLVSGHSRPLAALPLTRLEFNRRGLNIVSPFLSELDGTMTSSGGPVFEWSNDRRAPSGNPRSAPVRLREERIW